MSEKYVYSPSDLVFSPGWVTSDFRSADKQRKLERDSNKAQNAENLGKLFAFIEENEICSFAVFMREIYKHYPQYETVAVQNHAIIRDYIRDKRFDVSCGFADLDYKQVCKELKVARDCNAGFEDKINDLWETIRSITAEREQWKEEYLKTRTVLSDTLRLNQQLLKSNANLNEMLGFEEIPLGKDG